jgi:hypothetical protein
VYEFAVDDGDLGYQSLLYPEKALISDFEITTEPDITIVSGL